MLGKQIPGSWNQILDRLVVGQSGGLRLDRFGLQPDVPRVAEVLDDKVLDVVAAVVATGLPSDRASRLGDVDDARLARRRRRS